MLTQYGSKLVIPILTLQHAIRLRLAGNKGYHAYKGGSANARRLEKLSSLIGDARVLFRIWGVLPMLKWVSGSERLGSSAIVADRVSRLLISPSPPSLTLR